MYVYLTDSLAQTLDPDVARGLREALNTYDFFEHAMDSGLQAILSTPHHLPCLTHVIHIQLAVNAFLRELKIDAQNDDVIGIRWNDDDKDLKEKGLIRTLEKVRLLILFFFFIFPATCAWLMLHRSGNLCNMSMPALSAGKASDSISG